MFSRTLRQASSVAVWKTNPMSLRGPSIEFPPSSISPCVFRSRPASNLNNVLLPQPLGPTMARNSPAGMSIFRSLRAIIGIPTRALYSLPRPRHEIRGDGPAVAERELSDIRPSTADSMMMPWPKLSISPTLVPECSQEPCRLSSC